MAGKRSFQHRPGPGDNGGADSLVGARACKDPKAQEKRQQGGGGAGDIGAAAQAAGRGGGLEPAAKEGLDPGQACGDESGDLGVMWRHLDRGIDQQAAIGVWHALVAARFGRGGRCGPGRCPKRRADCGKRIAGSTQPVQKTPAVDVVIPVE